MRELSGPVLLFLALTTVLCSSIFQMLRPGAPALPFIILNAAAAIAGMAGASAALVAFLRARRRNVELDASCRDCATEMDGYRQLAAEGLGLLEEIAGLIRRDAAGAGGPGGERPGLIAMREAMAGLKERIDLEKIKNPAAYSFLVILVEIYHKIPYLVEFLNKVKERTEGAAVSLLDRFEEVAYENSRADREAGENMEKLRNIAGGMDFGALIDGSRAAIENYKGLEKSLLGMGRENLERSRVLEEKAKGIYASLAEITEIAQRNKVIYLNLSIEAVQLGEKGKGIKVIIEEIRKLNEATNGFVKQITQSMNAFIEFNAKAVEIMDRDSHAMIKSVEETGGRSGEVMKALVESYDMTSRFFASLRESTGRVNRSMGHIMESLQFQDITRQQIENVVNFLTGIGDSIRKEERSFRQYHVDLYEEQADVHDRIRDEFRKQVKVFDEKVVIDTKQ